MGKGAQADPDLYAGAALNQSVSQATQPSDELIRKACDGDASALEELVRAVYPLVLRWARAEEHLGEKPNRTVSRIANLMAMQEIGVSSVTTEAESCARTIRRVLVEMQKERGPLKPKKI